MTIKVPSTLADELLPCPFCGKRDHLFVEPDEVGSGGQWVSPVHAGCATYTGCGVSVSGDDTAEAITAWNTRASPVIDREAVLEEAVRCPNCHVEFQKVNDVDEHIRALSPVGDDRGEATDG